jgi:hypothetical protein
MVGSPPAKKKWPWTRIQNIVRKHQAGLAPTLRTFGAIGSAIAAVNTLHPGESADTRALVELQAVLINARDVELLRGFDLDFSRERFVRDSIERKEVNGYIGWAQAKASDLNDRLVERFTAASSPVQERIYISSTEATDLSDKLDVPLTRPQITKLSKKVPAPFETHKPSSQRLEVELTSFVSYVYKVRCKSRREVDEGEDDE